MTNIWSSATAAAEPHKRLLPCANTAGRYCASGIFLNVSSKIRFIIDSGPDGS